MRIFLIFFGFASANNPFCYTANLDLPANTKGWECDGSSNVTVSNNEECTVICDDNYRLEFSEYSKRDICGTMTVKEVFCTEHEHIK